MVQSLFIAIHTDIADFRGWLDWYYTKQYFTEINWCNKKK